MFFEFEKTGDIDFLAYCDALRLFAHDAEGCGVVLYENHRTRAAVGDLSTNMDPTICSHAIAVLGDAIHLGNGELERVLIFGGENFEIGWAYDVDGDSSEVSQALVVVGRGGASYTDGGTYQGCSRVYGFDGSSNVESMPSDGEDCFEVVLVCFGRTYRTFYLDTLTVVYAENEIVDGDGLGNGEGGFAAYFPFRLSDDGGESAWVGLACNEKLVAYRGWV